jgi:hypothetical protein
VAERVTVPAGWDTLTWLACALRVWTREITSAAEGNRVVRCTLADWTRLAFTAWPTEAGPWAMAVDIASGYLARTPGVYKSGGFATDPGPLGTVCKEQLERLCVLYAGAYELSYLGDWTLSEREDIVMRLRMYDVVAATEAAIIRELKGPNNYLDPLRCALDTLLRHEEGSLLVCAVAADIYGAEVAKSWDWLRRMEQREEVNEWPEVKSSPSG